jgi:hypothetical protein
MTINPKVPEKEVQQKLIDVSTEFNLTQVHDTPTREDNLLDIVLTTNATLVKSSANIPGLSDHDIIITDAIIKSTYNKNKPQKRYLYSKNLVILHFIYFYTYFGYFIVYLIPVCFGVQVTLLWFVFIVC